MGIDNRRKICKMSLWRAYAGLDAQSLIPTELVDGEQPSRQTLSTTQAINSVGINHLTDTSSGGDMPPLACRWLPRSVELIAWKLRDQLRVILQAGQLKKPSSRKSGIGFMDALIPAITRWRHTGPTGMGSEERGCKQLGAEPLERIR